MDVKTQSDSAAVASPENPLEDEQESTLGFVWFVTKLVIAVLIFRSFVFSPFSIPSESMLPRLWDGDYLLAAKWSYGYSNYSLPFSAPLIPGRILAGQPDRGDIVIFKHPVDKTDYIKRVIGLPGDSVAMVGGQVVLNGEPLKQRVAADFVQPVSQNMIERQTERGARGLVALSPCGRKMFEEAASDGARQCRYPRLVETLPGGRNYEVLNFENTFADNYAATIVPKGHLFVMGDNRDSSQDSRFPAREGGGVGIVSQELLVGEAFVIIWSSDGSAEWIKPWTWFSATRWDRIGTGL